MPLLPVIEPGYLTVGVDASPPPPMQIGDPSTPEFGGYEVDLLREVARRCDLGLRFRSALWSEILADLEAHRLDVVCTAATVSDERRARYLIGRPYLDIELVAVVRRRSSIKNVEDLGGHRFAVRTATMAETYLRRELDPAAITLTEYNDEAYDAVESGRVAALIDDSPIAGWYVRQRPTLKVIAALPGTRSEYAMIFARDGARLAGPLDRVLAAIAEDGTLAQLRDRWFESAIPVQGRETHPLR